MKKLLVLAVAGLIAFTANASNWVEAGKSNTTLTYVDTDSISSSGKYKTAFVRWIYLANQILPASVYQEYNMVTSFEQFDCSSNPKKIILISQSFMKDGEVVRTRDYDNSKWNITYPDTIDESITDIVCSY